jgi:hypothetical protein
MPATRKDPEELSEPLSEPLSAPTDPWMSVPEAARALGVANATVLQMALRGELVNTLVAKRTYVARESVDRLLAARAAQTK